MNICEKLLEMICDEINLFETFDNIKDMDSQYHYVLGMLDSSSDIGVISSTDYRKLKRELKYEYDYHKDRIGELEESNVNEK